jgi:GT2 family glycosyltransferase
MIRVNRLAASIVIFRGDEVVLLQVIEALARAVRSADLACLFYLIDNDQNGRGAAILEALPESVKEVFSGIELIVGQGNVGYGAGHNLAIRASSADLHLILNPDAIVEPQALRQAVQFLSDHDDVVLLAPAVYGSNGELQYLCRRKPAVFDLLLRGFAPASVRARFARRLAKYQMQDLINGADVLFDPPIVSGCCMLFRAFALKQLGGFDERFFLYFEDYDLSLRAHAFGRTAYVPAVRLTHLGGNAARKGLRHIRMFGASAMTFFSLHGWRWW